MKKKEVWRCAINQCIMGNERIHKSELQQRINKNVAKQYSIGTKQFSSFIRSYPQIKERLIQ